jgi:epsin
MLDRMVRGVGPTFQRPPLIVLLVRVSAKELTALILDEERLRAERSDRKTWKSRVTGIEEFGPTHEQPQRRNTKPHRAQRADEEDAEYKLAIEASKYQEEEDRKKRQSRNGEPDDDDLAKAIKLSKEEEELRRRELEDQNAHSLFDDDPIQTMQPTGGFNQGYQQQPQVDWAGNPIDQSMQQQPTGYMGNMYTGFQNQPTGYQNGFSNGFQTQNGFDPYAQQQLQQQQLQPQPPQQTGFNPYVQQNAFSPQPQPEPLIQANTNNPWATNNQQAQAIKPSPTGSNNPFAQSFGRPQTSSAVQSKPTLATLQEQKTATFNNTPSYNPITSFTPPPKEQDPYAAKLNTLLSSGEGMDTFGNTGNLRIPAQHTAPGTFVNSAGAGLGRLTEQQTGTNPFLQTQYTGMPQTSYNNSSGVFGAGRQVPAATGPAGMSNGFGGGYGAQSGNPFGQRPQQGSGGQDLIQF